MYIYTYMYIYIYYTYMYAQNLYGKFVLYSHPQTPTQ